MKVEATQGKNNLTILRKTDEDRPENNVSYSPLRICLTGLNDKAYPDRTKKRDTIAGPLYRDLTNGRRSH